MGKLKSERERRLQKKLIPVNIVVCIIALAAAISLFLAPIIKVDVGKILRDDRIIEFVEEKIDDTLGEEMDNSGKDDINYKPVVTSLVKNILSKSKGSVTISAVSAFRVVTAGENKSEKVLDELLFGKHALATNLINSIVDGIANMFSTDKGRDVLEQAILSTLTNQIVDSVGNKDVADAFNKNARELTEIFRELGGEDAAKDNGASVAKKFIDKLDEALSDPISEENKQAFIDHVTELYSNTQSHLGDGETVSFEAIICVTLSENLDLSQVNLGDLFDGLFSKDEQKESSVHIGSVDDEISDDSDDESNNKVVTNYDDLLLEMGYDKNAKENLKEKMRTALNDELNKIVKEQGIDGYLEYYQYVFYGMLFFIALWLILFLFAFFHLFANNKRFSMWYVKLFCWIPALIWLILVVAPKLATKVSVVSDMWNGENGKVVQAVFGGISSLTWISGLCYVLMWLVSIFWAFPIKRKIRKERKYPEVEDVIDNSDEFGGF